MDRKIFGETFINVILVHHEYHKARKCWTVILFSGQKLLKRRLRFRAFAQLRSGLNRCLLRAGIACGCKTIISLFPKHGKRL